MLLLYSFALLVASGLRALVGARAARLGRRYSRLTLAVQTLLRASAMKPGNGKTDAGQSARQQLELGLLVRKRDLLESRHYAWQHAADRLAGWTRRLRAWKGQKVPYTMGVVDVWLLLALVDHLGVNHYFSSSRLVQLAREFLGL